MLSKPRKKLPEVAVTTSERIRLWSQATVQWPEATVQWPEAIEQWPEVIEQSSEAIEQSSEAIEQWSEAIEKSSEAIEKSANRSMNRTLYTIDSTIDQKHVFLEWFQHY